MGHIVAHDRKQYQVVDGPCFMDAIESMKYAYDRQLRIPHMVRFKLGEAIMVRDKVNIHRVEYSRSINAYIMGMRHSARDQGDTDQYVISVQAYVDDMKQSRRRHALGHALIHFSFKDRRGTVELPSMVEVANL